MSLRTVGESIFLLCLIVLVLSLMAGSVLGQPILLSYVETGSMSPTLESGDGFVAIPAPLAGPIEKGDVVVFKSREIQGGGLTTHRIVGKTDRGYVTKGDANPFPDQDSAEPPVKQAQIVAVAWQPGKSVFVLPQLGTAIEGIQSGLSTVKRHLASFFGTRALLNARGLVYLFFGLTVIWYVIGEWREKNGKDTHRSEKRKAGTDARLLVGLFALLLVVGATAAMVGPAGTEQYDVVSAEFESDRPTVIRTGESHSFDRPVNNDGVLPVVVYIQSASEGVEVTPQKLHLPGREQVNATVTLHAPTNTGYYRRFVTHNRYLAILPHSTIDTLYRFHPWVPIIVIDALIGIPFYLIGVRLVGTGRLRRRPRVRSLPMITRIRRALKRLY